MAVPAEATVLVGKKPLGNYVLATVMQFNAGTRKVVLKARGSAVGKAIAVAYQVQDAILRDRVQITGYRIYAERVPSPRGGQRMVGAIEITLELKS